jgi:CRISPR-associated exonuclease Cas4
MFAEDDLIPLSSLQHLHFCERRAALIFIEGIWEDNLFTVEGSHLHKRTHASETESRGELRIARGLPLRSIRLGLSGKADVVEFHRLAQDDNKRFTNGSLPFGIRLEGVAGLWHPFPVEYKRGKLRHEEGYEVQLCAQALCLEEMLNVAIPSGALYYGKTGRRLELSFDKGLREKTEAASMRMHELVRLAHTPEAGYSKKCEKCSLFDVCLPKVMNRRRSVSRYLANVTIESEEASDEAPC